MTADTARGFGILGPLAMGGVLAALATYLAAGSACRPAASSPPREVPRLDRPALDPRLVPAGADRNHLRLDDVYDAFVWEGAEPASSAPERSGWEFQTSNEGWTLTTGGRPEIKGGRLVFRSNGKTSLVSQPGLGLRFRTIRAIEIRMSVSKGRRLSLAWSPGEGFKEQKLSVEADLRVGPEPAVYVVKASSLSGYEGLALNRLSLTPTDAAEADVEIDSIRLVSREGLYAGLGHGLGREEIGNQSRNVIYARAPGSYTTPILVPPNAALDVGVGVLDAAPGVTFSVAVEGEGPRQTILEHAVEQDESWEDLRADLSAWAGKTVRLRFAVRADRPGSVALWSNPTVTDERTPPERPNVILYLIDTLRADHVGVYGARNATTPAIDRLAREGILFERCTSQAAWTRPSVASILTSLYPPDHGNVDDGQRVSDGAITLAEQFRRFGFLTAGFSASTLSGSSPNLTQGYDEFLELPAILGGPTPLLDKHARTYTRQTGDRINLKLLPWIERNQHRPFFVFIHSTDPHGPYSPAAPYDRLFDTGYRGPIDGSYDPEIGFEKAKTREELAWVMSLYDGDIRCNDDAVGELVKTLGRLDLLRRTAVVVTSDHGEEFRDHGKFGHGQSLYEEIVHVPLVIRPPDETPIGRLPRGERVSQPVQSVDVFPTLCRLVGIPAPADARGVSRLDLTSGSGKTTSGGHLPVHDASLVHEGGLSPVGETLARSGPVFAWRSGREGEEVSVSDGRYKLIQRVGMRDLLFDLASDPGEKNDLSKSESGRLAALRGQVESWWASRRRIVSGEDRVGVLINQEEREWLSALGYVK